MKITKTASGKQTIKMSKKEWTSIGKKAGWMKKATTFGHIPDLKVPVDRSTPGFADRVQQWNVELQPGDEAAVGIISAERAGKWAFKDGKEANPSLDLKFMEVLKIKTPEERKQLLEAWLKGWNKAKLSQ